MKKLLITLLAVITVFAFGACGSAGTEETADGTQATEAADNGNIPAIGVLTYCNVEEDGLNEAVFGSTGQQSEHIYFESLTDMKMALTSGEIDIAVTGEATAEYILAKDDSITTQEPYLKATNNYGMLLMAENQELCDEISGVIQDLKDDGTLEQLQKDYIEAYVSGEEPEVEEIASIGDAKTITVGVTGDLPPMDFINAKGEPAGFNVALLAAIGDRLGININLLTVTAGSRAAALSSGKADVIFWTLSQELGNPDMGNPFLDADTPENTVKTLPYFSENNANLVLK